MTGDSTPPFTIPSDTSFQHTPLYVPNSPPARRTAFEETSPPLLITNIMNRIANNNDDDENRGENNTNPPQELKYLLPFLCATSIAFIIILILFIKEK